MCFAELFLGFFFLVKLLQYLLCGSASRIFRIGYPLAVFGDIFPKVDYLVFAYGNIGVYLLIRLFRLVYFKPKLVYTKLSRQNIARKLLHTKLGAFYIAFEGIVFAFGRKYLFLKIVKAFLKL